MITAGKAIEAIQEKINEIEGIQFYDQFYPWQKSTIGTLKRVAQHNQTIIEHLSSIKSIGPYGGDMKETAKRDAKQILESLIKDIERFGLEEPPKIIDKEVIKVDVNQNNQQTQTTSVSVNLKFFIDILKGELRSSEIDELKEILDSSDEAKEKKKRFMDKIKSFGSDVASNILANLLTNPQVYEQLGGML